MPTPDHVGDGQLSSSAVRLLRRPRPRYRGYLHRWAALASIPLGVTLTVFAEGTRAQFSMLLYSLGITAMLGVSAVVHGRDWSARRVELLVRIDHSVIFLMFGTCATPIALLGLDPPVSGLLIAAYTLGAVVVGARRPDPWPDTFGYHEIWHVHVVVAVACHTLLVVSLAY